MKIQRVSSNLHRQLEGRFVYLSCNKYGSNVVEKFFHDAGVHLSEKIIAELLNSPNVSRLLVDPFGNYVICTALVKFKVSAFECMKCLEYHAFPQLRILSSVFLSWNKYISHVFLLEYAVVYHTFGMWRVFLYYKQTLLYSIFYYMRSSLVYWLLLWLCFSYLINRVIPTLRMPCWIWSKQIL